MKKFTRYLSVAAVAAAAGASSPVADEGMWMPHQMIGPRPQVAGPADGPRRPL
ncbi:MAG: hypothetical protein MZV70_52830 [Desulfobacterales bacterium]|nr:hypothetical protein [Desulfobacterales bacterium]